MENNQNYSRSYADSKSRTGSSESVDDANENRPALDAMVFAAPEYREDDKEQIVENNELLESSMGRLNIEQEANASTSDSRRQFKATYELESFDKHAMVIFNQKEIYCFRPRFGTESDVDSLTRTFNNFGFEVTPHNNLTKEALFGELKKFCERDFTDYGCVVVAILTHGTNKGVLWAKNQRYSEIEIINHFNEYSKPSLKSKPKIFIIQACRGSTDQPGVPVRQPGQKRKDLDEKDSEPNNNHPLEPNWLILHSSYPGCTSIRDKNEGSWFIQTLCKKINTLFSTHDLQSIMTEVKKDVAINKEYKETNKITQETNVCKQMPIITSTLIRKLYLKKVGERALEETNVDKASRRSKSRDEVMDVVSSSPRTPLFDQFGPCSCSLEHFTYMRNCLRYFVAENPNDETAQDLLDVANTYEDSDNFNKSKDKICKVISKHLLNKAQESQIHKYLHFDPVERKVTKSKNAQSELSLKSSFSFLDICLTGFYMAAFFFILRNVKRN